MHIYRSRFAASALALIVLVALGACSSSSKSSNSSSSTTSSSSGGGDKTAFCKTNSELDAATASVTDPAQLAQVFKDNDAKLDAALETAPDEVKADTEKLVSAAKQVAQTGDITPFQSDQSLQTAGQHLDSYCGVSSSGSSTGN